MRTIVAFLTAFFVASSFAASSSNMKNKGEKWQERIVRECQEYALRTIDSDTGIAKIFAANSSLKEYTPIIVGMTCTAEATRNLEKMNRKIEEMIREAKKRVQEEKNASRASKTM